MADTVYPITPPPMPPEFVDALGDTGPGPFVYAMESGMREFAQVLEEGGDIAAGGEAFIAFMHDACVNGEIPGVTPEVFDSVADSFSDVAGPALMGLAADAGPAEMSEVFADAAAIMTPLGFDMPPEVADMCTNMGDTFADVGVGPHDIGSEFGPPMPDGFIPGDLATFPEGEFAPLSAEIAESSLGSDVAAALNGALGAGPIDGPEAMEVAEIAIGGSQTEGDMASVTGDSSVAADVAIGSALDATMEQGGASEVSPIDDGAIAGDISSITVLDDEVDPSAGMS